MCTVTFWPRDQGFLVGMNRDEKRTRAVGLPPSLSQVRSRNVVHPREPGGGTWIAANDRGVGFALVNWYAVVAGATQPSISRGGVVMELRDCAGPEEASLRLGRLNLAGVNPFRLIGFFPSEALLWEWRWDLRRLVGEAFPWAPRQWISSGHDEPGAQRTRGAAFERLRMTADAGSVGWLRRVHASHDPEPGAYSTCMHRADAATVSYTEVSVSGTEVAVGYHAGSPCVRFPGELSSIRMERPRTVRHGFTKAFAGSETDPATQEANHPL